MIDNNINMIRYEVNTEHRASSGAVSLCASPGCQKRARDGTELCISHGDFRWFCLLQSNAVLSVGRSVPWATAGHSCPAPAPAHSKDSALLLLLEVGLSATRPPCKACLARA